MTKKQERIESESRASIILMMRTQLNRRVPELRIDKKYLDQIKGVSLETLENDVKTNLSPLPYDTMTALIGDLPKIMKTEWIPIDYEALGL